MNTDVWCQVGNSIEGYGEITRISSSYIWFGSYRRRIETISNKLVGIKYKESPNIDVNWKDEQEVDEYYKMFKQWAGVVRMGDMHGNNRGVFEVKNNKVFHDGEYYLPYYSHHVNMPEKKFLDDCVIFGNCLKIKNSYWALNKGEKIVNVFYIEQVVEPEMIVYQAAKAENKRVLSDIDYMKSLNLQRLNNSDLDLLQNKFRELFDDRTFPYTTNNVTFRHGDFGRIEVLHRNRNGYLKINNSYYGPQPYELQYGSFLECNPYFTNECRYQTRCEGKELTFDKTMLDILSIRIVKTWDLAIENNASLRYSW